MYVSSCKSVDMRIDIVNEEGFFHLLSELLKMGYLLLMFL